MTQKPGILEVIQKYLVDQEHFPVLNPEAARIQNEVLKPEPDLSAVKKLIQTDPTLTGEILKVANSPYYKGLGEVSTIKEAALRLGQSELFNIIMRVILRKNFSSKDPMIRARQNRLWDHSVATAFSSHWLAKHLKMTELLPKSFIAGLLHDMGKLCLLSALEQMLASEADKAGLTENLIEKILIALHEKQGYNLLRKWHLPEHYCRIARDHHVPDFDTTDVLLVVVRLANMVCDKVERSDPEEDLSYIIGSVEADLLGVKETGMALLEVAMEDAGMASRLTQHAVQG